jgi:hypothetical protein
VLTLVAVSLAIGCADSAVAPGATSWTPTPSPGDLAVASAHSERLDGASLVNLAHWIRDTPSLPIFSILISRHGKLVFELYTGGLDRPQAHYMMSVSKSVLSAVVGKRSAQARSNRRRRRSRSFFRDRCSRRTQTYDGSVEFHCVTPWG